MTESREFGSVALAEQTPRATTRRLVRELAEDLKASEAAYAGGLPAEAQSRRAKRELLKKRMRATVFGGRGRRIDLVAIMGKARPDGKPAWALVDPAEEISPFNGGRDFNGDPKIYSDRPGYSSCTACEGERQFTNFLPSGLPPLPQRVRRIVTDPIVRKHAEWVGVLYQPDEWVLINPDPAVVVKWRGTPEGHFHVLAAWGGDRPGIMEFVD